MPPTHVEPKPEPKSDNEVLEIPLYAVILIVLLLAGAVAGVTVFFVKGLKIKQA